MSTYIMSLYAGFVFILSDDEVVLWIYAVKHHLFSLSVNISKVTYVPTVLHVQS